MVALDRFANGDQRAVLNSCLDEVDEYFLAHLEYVRK